MNASATNNVLYAYCASGRDKASGYTVTAIDSISGPNDEVVLRLTSSGHPRILQPGTANGHNGFDILARLELHIRRVVDAHARARRRLAVDLAVAHADFAVGPACQLASLYSSGDGMHVGQCNPTGPNMPLTTGISWGQVQLRIDSAGTLHTAFVDLSNPTAYKAVVPAVQHRLRDALELGRRAVPQPDPGARSCRGRSTASSHRVAALHETVWT